MLESVAKRRCLKTATIALWLHDAKRERLALRKRQWWFMAFAGARPRGHVHGKSAQVRCPCMQLEQICII